MTSTDKAPERFDPPRDTDWKSLPMRVDIAGRYVRASDYNALAAENEALRDEVERLVKIVEDERALNASEFEVLESPFKDAAAKAEAERDQALAQLAAVQIHMRERAAVKCFVDRGRFDTPDRIRALPLDPDAEAALKRHDAALIERISGAIEVLIDAAGRVDLCERREGLRDALDAIRALARPTEGEQDV